MEQGNLFGGSENSAIIRTLGFYQPFGSLMLHGKIETRWCREGRKPPFPLGKYLFYTTLKKCDQSTLFDWCGAELMLKISETLEGEVTSSYLGGAIGIGELTLIQPMAIYEEEECFVKWKGLQQRLDKKGVSHNYKQQCLYFKNIQRIKPFIFKGKQGVGILTDEEKSKIEFI